MTDVKVKLNKKQFKAYTLLTDHTNGLTEILYGGGARGGKSWLGCFWQILNRINYPNSVGFVARKDFSRLVDTTIKTFFEVLRTLGMEKVGYFRNSANGNESAFSYYFPNGSMIYFRYIKHDPQDPNYDRFGSYSFTDMFVDEAQEIDEKAISVLRGRFSLLSGKGADGKTWHTIPKSLFSCNPKKNWIYTDFVRPATDGTLKPFRAFIKALPTDNPYLDKAYLENLLRSDKVTVQRLYYGNFEYDDDPTVLCDYDAICDVFANEHIKPVGVKTCSGDIAGKGHDRFVVGAWIGNVCSIAVDMEYSPGKIVVDKIRQVQVDYGIPRSMTVVDADGIGSFVESFLDGIKEFHGGGTPKDSKYQNLRAQCMFMLARLINERKIRIIAQNEEQKQRIKEELGLLKQAHIDSDIVKLDIIKKDEMKKLLGRSPDYLDMLSMSMTFRLAKPLAEPQVRVQRRS